MKEYLEYDGQELHWHHDDGTTETFAATSGFLGFDEDTGIFVGYQEPKQQCVRDRGPIPEGTYYLRLSEDPDGYADHDGSLGCNLQAGSGIQRIPRGGTGTGSTTVAPTATEANSCEPYWANWGSNRVRLEPADSKTTNACSPRRGGFYLHDSTKGFTHGCVEVDTLFFVKLRAFVPVARRRKLRRLTLKVRYIHSTTEGATKKVP